MEAALTTLDELELELLLEGIFRRYGIDLRGYSRESLSRRIRQAMVDAEIESPITMLARVLREPDAMAALLEKVSVTVTTMFRDPSFFAAFREKAVPHLFAHPFVRVWHAGCSTGEEVYSMAILLHEEGLYERCRLYATDISPRVLEQAKSGIFPLSQMAEYTANYLKAGGKREFSEYYRAHYDHAIFRRDLRRNMIFAQHNLAIDGSFNEFNVILCRNVLIYFNPDLQARVRELLHRSLKRHGILALGNRETLGALIEDQRYKPIDEIERIYERKPDLLNDTSSDHHLIMPEPSEIE